MSGASSGECGWNHGAPPVPRVGGCMFWRKKEGGRRKKGRQSGDAADAAVAVVGAAGDAGAGGAVRGAGGGGREVGPAGRHGAAGCGGRGAVRAPVAPAQAAGKDARAVTNLNRPLAWEILAVHAVTGALYVASVALVALDIDDAKRWVR